MELVLIQEDGSRRSFPLNSSEVQIGRSSKNDISFTEKSVSRKHCKLSQNGENWLIEDLSSTNGTYVNGAKVEKEKLKGGEKIKLGRLELELSVKKDSEKKPKEEVKKSEEPKTPEPSEETETELESEEEVELSEEDLDEELAELNEDEDFDLNGLDDEEL